MFPYMVKILPFLRNMWNRWWMFPGLGMRKVNASRLPESSGSPGHPPLQPARRWTPGSGLLAGFGRAASTTRTAGTTGTWWIRLTPSGTRSGSSSRGLHGVKGLASSSLPLGCSCFLCGRLNITVKQRPSSAPDYGCFQEYFSFCVAARARCTHLVI